PGSGRRALVYNTRLHGYNPAGDHHLCASRSLACRQISPKRQKHRCRKGQEYSITVLSRRNAAFTTNAPSATDCSGARQFPADYKLCIVFQSPKLPPLWQLERVVKAQTPKESAL